MLSVVVRKAGVDCYRLWGKPSEPGAGQRRWSIVTPAQASADQPVGLGVTSTPPALAKVQGNRARERLVQFTVHVGPHHRSQSKVYQWCHVAGTLGVVA